MCKNKCSSSDDVEAGVGGTKLVGNSSSSNVPVDPAETQPMLGRLGNGARPTAIRVALQEKEEQESKVPEAGGEIPQSSALEKAVEKAMERLRDLLGL